MILTRKYPLLTLTLLLNWSGHAISQTKDTWVIDSLKVEFQRSEYDSTKSRIADDLCYEYYNISIDSSLKYARISGLYASKAGDVALLAQSHNSQGVCFLNKSSLMTALDQFQKAYELFHRCGNKKGEAKMLNNLGVIYSETEDYVRAIEKYNQSFKLNDEQGIWYNASNALYNLSGSHFQMKDYDLAQHYAEELEKYHEIHPNTITPYPLYGDIFEQRGELDSARYYLELSLKEQEEKGDVYNWSVAIINLARVIMKQGDPKLADQVLDKAAQTITENGLIDAEMSYFTLKAEIFKALSQPDLAYDYQLKALKINDSIDHLNQMNMINDMNTKYETDRMESQISEQKHVIESKQMWLVTILIVSLLLFVGLFAVVYVLRRNRRLNKLLKLQNNQINHQRQKIISSINYAKRIQQSTLPKEQEFKTLFKDSFIYFKPKDIISGDFYAYQQLGSKIYVAAVDCTGHGVPGAFMSLIANAKLNKVVNEMGERDPGKILNLMHREIQHALHQESGQEHTMDGVEMSLCAIDLENNVIDFAAAGSSIFIVRDRQIMEYKGSYSGLGGIDYTWNKGQVSSEFTTQQISYHPEDMLFLFSDGIHDQIGGAELKKLNKGKFKEHLMKLSETTFDQAVQQCDQFISDWRNNHQQTDDMMLIGIRL